MHIIHIRVQLHIHTRTHVLTCVTVTTLSLILPCVLKWCDNRSLHEAVNFLITLLEIFNVFWSYFPQLVFSLTQPVSDSFPNANTTPTPTLFTLGDSRCKIFHLVNTAQFHGKQVSRK